MSRNGSGSYTLPATVNPVVDGTTITIAWANTTLDDIATALTDSLDRNGKGGMLAPLRCADGSVSAPSYSFTADTDSGLYRAGANDVRMGAGNQLVGKWTPTGYEVTGTSSSSGPFLAANGTAGAPGYAFTAEPGSGLYRAGAGDVRLSISAADVLKLTAAGADITGTLAVSSTVTSAKITATGGAGVAGGVFANGTAATGAVRQNACELTNGDLDMSGVANPDASVAIVNRITPANTHKAFARIQTNGIGGVTLLGGMNIASVAIGGGGAYVSIVLAGPMADLVNHSINALPYAAGALGVVEAFAGSVQGASFNEIRIYGAQTTIGSPPTTSVIDFAATVRNFYVDIVGRQ